MREKTRLMTRIRILLESFSSVVLLIMATHIVLNAVGRRLFRAPIEGTTEYTKFWYMPAIVLIGIVLAESAQEHIAANVLFQRVSPSMQRFFRIVGLASLAFVTVGFAFYGTAEALESLSFYETGGLINVPVWPIKLMIPIFFSIFVYLALRRTRSSLRPILVREDANEN